MDTGALPPPSKPPALDPRDQILLQMQRALCDFYTRFNQAKLTKSTVSILMQYWWDYGLGPLNKKLKIKYGQGLRLSQDPLQNWYEGSFSITIVPKKEARLESFQQFLIIKGITRQNSTEHFSGPDGRPLKKAPWKDTQRISRPEKKPPPTAQLVRKQPKSSTGPPAGVNRNSWLPPDSPGRSFRRDPKLQNYRPNIAKKNRKHHNHHKSKRNGGNGKNKGRRSSKLTNHTKASRVQKSKTQAAAYYL